MQLVIDIDDEIYDRYLNYTENYIDFMFSGTEEKIVRAFRKGTPLPKEHGKLGDLDAVMSDISTSIDTMTNIGIAVDGNYLWAKLNDAIYNAPTIIEAERTEE